MRVIQVLFFLHVLGCQSSTVNMPYVENDNTGIDQFYKSNQVYREGKGALLLTRFSSIEEFKAVVQVKYVSNSSQGQIDEVCLMHSSGGREVTSILKKGISQLDFMKAKNGTLMDKLSLGMRCPYALFHKPSLLSVEKLGRRRPWDFGKGDVAFYDLAEMMVQNIREEDRMDLSCEDLDEKGYLNSFNHITAQAFITSIYSERLADFIADVHELYNMPELVTGEFTNKQLADFVNGPVDNYLDMINNEWGQELGKVLDQKYKIDEGTFWTPFLLVDYLNDIQAYQGWAFGIGFKPFRADDNKIIQFAAKINKVIGRDTSYGI